MDGATSDTYELAGTIRLQDIDREYILLGVEHVGVDSSGIVERLIALEQPDEICVDLDIARSRVLTDEEQWQSLSIKQVINEKLMTALMLNLLLSAYLRKLDDNSGAMPGAELQEAVQNAQANSIPYSLVERDLHISYARAWRSVGLRQKVKMLLTALVRLFKFQNVADSGSTVLHETDVMSAFLDELTRWLPDLKQTLIEERDEYSVRKMRAAPGNKIVAVVGAGRLENLGRTLLASTACDTGELEQIPETSPLMKWASRIVPLLLVIGLLYVGWSQGSEFIRGNLVFWILANSVFTGIGAIVAGAHVLTILTAVVVAPFSPLIPAGPGTVAAIVQAIIRPPLVRDFQTFADDITHPRQWRKNRILKIVLVLVLCGLGSLLGTALGTSKIIWSLFNFG